MTIDCGWDSVVLGCLSGVIALSWSLVGSAAVKMAGVGEGEGEEDGGCELGWYSIYGWRDRLID